MYTVVTYNNVADCVKTVLIKTLMPECDNSLWDTFSRVFMYVRTYIRRLVISQNCGHQNCGSGDKPSMTT